MCSAEATGEGAALAAPREDHPDDEARAGRDPADLLSHAHVVAHRVVLGDGAVLDPETSAPAWRRTAVRSEGTPA
jgi:hypothetical protein